MKFRTDLEIQPTERKITHARPVFGIGSCFVESMGEKLKESKFQVITNPFGNLFHPLAIENALARILSLTKYTPDEIFKFGEVFFSWDHHTSFSQISLDATLNKINSELELANDFIQKADVFLLTFGTAWVYRIKEMGIFVANCHKVPNSNFDKYLLDDKQIQASLKNCFNLILDINPNAQIIATVSPVRHTKDGIVENSLSKSKLISNLYDVAQKFETVEYFPAYELMMDDLRDYRFYKKDLVHPSDMAVDYIWEKFSSTYFDSETNEKIKIAEKIGKAIAHRPLNSSTTSYKEFLYKTGKKIESVESLFPKNSFEPEKSLLHNLMKNAD